MWSRPWIAYMAVIIGVLGHASSEFVAKLSGVGGPELSSWRYMIGGAGLLVLALLSAGSRDLVTPMREQGGKITALSLAGVSLAYLLFHWALDFATATQIATMVSTIPIFVGLSNLVINRQPISGAKWLSGAAAIVGIALLLTDGYLDRLLAEGGSLTGIIMAMGCAFLASAYAVLIRPVVAQYGALRITAISMAIGGIGLWLIVGVLWNIWVNPLAIAERPAAEAWPLLAMGLWNTTIAQYMWIGGLAHAPDITRASYIFFLKPVIAAGLAMMILGDSLTIVQIAAIVVICGAVAGEFLWTQYRAPVTRTRR